MLWADGMPVGLFTGSRTFEIVALDDAKCRFSMTESFELFAESLRRAAEAA